MIYIRRRSHDLYIHTYMMKMRENISEKFTFYLLYNSLFFSHDSSMDFYLVICWSYASVEFGFPSYKKWSTNSKEMANLRSEFLNHCVVNSFNVLYLIFTYLPTYLLTYLLLYKTHIIFRNVSCALKRNRNGNGNRSGSSAATNQKPKQNTK